MQSSVTDDRIIEASRQFNEFNFIFPALKMPASFHEQRQKLQRAKMGDLLKHKIQHRPDRTELIRKHILEGSSSFFFFKIININLNLQLQDASIRVISV